MLCYTKEKTEVTAMSRSIFHPDSSLMITMTQITDCIFLSLFWLLGCIPVVTIGTSCAALYDAVYHGFRRGDKHSWQRFAQSFRGSWKAGLVPTAVLLAGLFLLIKAVIGLWNSAVAGNISWMVFSGGTFVGILILGILSLMSPVLSRFENSTAALLKNTLFLAMANLPGTMGLGFLNAATIFLCARFVVPLFFLPALSALISTLFVEPMFKPFMPEEEE